jgi:hypothetical protein
MVLDRGNSPSLNRLLRALDALGEAGPFTPCPECRPGRAVA